MALFKRKTKVAEDSSKEYEEVLVAEEPTPETPAGSDEGAILADEPLAPPTEELLPEPSEPEPAPEPMMERDNPTPEPEPMRVPEPDFPPEVEAHLKRESLSLVLSENRFTRPVKSDIEGKVTPSPRASLAERTWHPAHRTPIKDIHKAIGALKPHKVRAAGQWLRTQFKPIKESSTRLEKVPGNILAKRIVYETEGGFVVEVTYRAGVETLKKYFTVPSAGDRTLALSEIQSGKYAMATAVSSDQVASLPKTGGAKFPTPPGKVDTYPITNKWDVLEVEGIGEIYARRLHELGIHTTDQLRLINATVIANNIGTNPTSVQQWQQMSELFGVEGIGKQYAEVLVKAGIAGVDDLKKQKPLELSKKCNSVIDASKPRIIGTHVRTPRAKKWVQNARRLRKSLQPFPVVEA